MRKDRKRSMTAIDLASIVTMERRESGFRGEVERFLHDVGIIIYQFLIFFFYIFVEMFPEFFFFTIVVSNCDLCAINN